MYRNVVEKILGSGAVIFESPTFEAMMRVLKDENLISVQGDTLEEALENHLRNLQNSGLVAEARFEKLSRNQYLFHVDKCIHAKRLHQCLKPFLKGQICPHALATIPIFRKFRGKGVKVAPSDFTEEGSKTPIER